MPEYLYGSYGRPIEIAGKSETSIFVRDPGNRGCNHRGRTIVSYTVSRRDMERDGKASSRWGEWLFLDREKALTHSAQEAERRMQEEREQRQRWQREQEAQRKREQDAYQERHREWQEGIDRTLANLERIRREHEARWERIQAEWRERDAQREQERRERDAEREGREREAAWERSWEVFGGAAQQGRTPPPTAEELRHLKTEMANAHPDLGGNSEAFIAARERYVKAKAAFEAAH